MTPALSLPRIAMPPSSRTALVAGSVVLLHVGALWALQQGLLQRAVELVVPVQMLASVVTPPRAEPAPAPAPPPPPVAVHRPPEPRKNTPAPIPKPAPAAPLPTAIPDPTPAPTAVTGTQAAQPAPPPVAAPVAAAPAPAPAPAPAAKVELPITDADYLDNPKPEWPRLSRRLGEQGRVLLRVLIGADGKAKSVQVKQSSGYTRLDEASIAAVLAGRYIPGKRGGVPEEMWVNIPFWWGEKDGEKNR